MRAADAMTPNVVTVRADATLNSALDLMLDHRISGVPVVDGDHLVGILTEGDLLRRTETQTSQPTRPKWLDFLLGAGHNAGDYVRTHSRRISDLMTQDVVTINEDTPLTEAVSLMTHKRIRRLPVLKDGKLVGILSRADLIRALYKAMAVKEHPGDTADIALEEKLKDELSTKEWFQPNNINISVKDGIVRLDGMISDDRLRDALRVAAENLPGVKGVRDHLVWYDPSSGLMMPPN